MVQPNLQNPVNVVIQKIDKANTVYDNRLRENVNIIRRTANLTFPAQIVYKRTAVDGAHKATDWEGNQNFGLAGYIENSDGYFVVRMVDLGTGEIEKGDKIVKFGQLTVEHYVVGFRPGAHYADQGGFTLLAVYFSDRSP